MVKFGEMVENGMATFKVNPLTKSFGVILKLDQLEDEWKGKKYFITVNEKEYEITKNRFKDNIKDVTLDTNKITEQQLKDALVTFKD